MGEPIVLAFEEREFGRSRLDEPADGPAAVLADRGVRAGQRVALMSSNRPEFVVTMSAV
ncbi:AMP-binding protein [Nocardia brevicatena]|uniref:AMP-binding protein n=1 Tax=Nocardia brevicatena TaxID=37327 RepID=UPI0003059416|nr:AMP-binding protein [Nocardia brevicatena]